MHDVSFIIVSWNARRYLTECLRSIERCATGVSHEVIVVDNASWDGSPEAVRGEFPDARLIRNDRNVGFARANNQAIEESDGRYLCLLNSDSLVLPGCIETLLAFMDGHPRVALAGPRILNKDGSLQRSAMKLPTLWSAACRALALDSIFPDRPFATGLFLPAALHGSMRDVEALSGCFWFARRAAVEAIGGLDERFFMYGEDLDWCRRFRLGGWLVVYDPDARAVHFGGASSANAPARFQVELQRANLAYWRKHRSALALAAMWWLLAVSHACRMACGAIRWLASAGRRPQGAEMVTRSAALLGHLFAPWRRGERAAPARPAAPATATVDLRQGG